MMKISVIMPVYNSEKYLPRAVDSVLNQDFDGFELILVDDGSKDRSGEICDRYAREHSNVKVIHKENGGICSARNTGFEIASGEYLAFCDNDDIYLPHLLKDNYGYAKEYDADFVRFSRIKVIVDKNGKKRTLIPEFYNGVVKKEEFGKYFLDIRSQDAVWTGLYRRSIVEEHKIRFDESIRYGAEDTYFNQDFLLYCNTIYFNNQAYYKWVQRYVHSTSRAFHEIHLKTFEGRLDKDERFIRKCCEQGICKKDRVFYGSGIVYLMIEYFNLAGASFGVKDRIRWLKKLRSHPFFRENFTTHEIREMFGEDKKTELMVYLFYRERYGLLLLTVGEGMKILNKIRMK